MNPYLKPLGVVLLGVVILGAGCTREPRKVEAPAFFRGPISFEVKAPGPAEKVVTELTKYARLFGYAPVPVEDKPAYVIRGRITLGEAQAPSEEGGKGESRWRLDADLELVDGGSGKTLERFRLPDYLLEKPDREDALRLSVRAGAKHLARFIFYDGETLGQQDVRNLLADLLIDTLEPYLYNDVVNKLAAIGERAVPYLIWKLNDRRRVVLAGDLPGLEPGDEKRVCVYHVANRALELILKRGTNLTVNSDEVTVIRYVRAWQRIWVDRCAAYRKGKELEKIIARWRAERAKEIARAKKEKVKNPGEEVKPGEKETIYREAK